MRKDRIRRKNDRLIFIEKYFTLSVWNGMGCKSWLASNTQNEHFERCRSNLSQANEQPRRAKEANRKHTHTHTHKEKQNQQQEKVNQQRNNIQFRKANNYMIITVQPTSLFFDQNCLWLLDCQCPVNVIVLLKFMVSKTEPKKRKKQRTNERTNEENNNEFHENVASHTFSFQILIFEFILWFNVFLFIIPSPCFRFGSFVNIHSLLFWNSIRGCTSFRVFRILAVTQIIIAQDESF